MRMKRSSWLVGVIGTTMALTLAACGGESTPTPPASTPTATTAPGETPQPTATPTSAPSFDAEEYFSGETIRIVVGFNPGGGTDLQARYLASLWGDYIPGNPNVVVQNQTPNIAAMNFVWASEPDGFTIVYTATSNIADSAEPQAEFSPKDMGIIGSPHARNVVWWTDGELPYDDITDAMGSSGPPLEMANGPAGAPEELTGATILGSLMLADFLDIPLEFSPIAGTGTDQQLIIFERGDISAFALGNVWNTLPERRPGWLSTGVVNTFANMSHRTSDLAPNAEQAMEAPQVFDLLTAEQQAQWEGFFAPDTFVGKTLMTPPGIQPEVLEVLRQAWVDALADPEFAEEYERLLQEPIRPLNGEDAQQTFTEVQDGYYEQLPNVAEVQQRVFDRFVQ